jgi:hypothetical protein
MSYFSKFPRVLYSIYKEGNDAKVVPDLLSRVKFLDNIISNQNLFFKYEIKGGETPEQIASRVYNDPQKHWIILLVNELIDPQFDWALGPYEFEKHIKQKYASLNVSLNTTESYPSNYTVGEVVYQGSTYDKSSAEATVVAYNSGTKTLQLSFASQVLANGSNITGVTSAQTHSIIGITNNQDGYQWAQNTISHYEATETRRNADDASFVETRKYRVTANAYSYTTGSIITINTNTSYSNTYNVVSSIDGSNIQFTVQTTIAPVTYYDHELRLNEDRRKIVVPKSSVITAIETQFASLMSVP